MANGKETQKVNSQNETWIDIAKAVCIVGVVLLHVAGYAYDNDFLYESCRFVVALFILIGGYNAIASYDRRGKFLLPKKLKSILVPYVVATVICCVWEQRFFDLKTILDALIHFNAVSPMYYVAAYVQLLIVTPVLIGVIHWCECGKSLMKAIKYLLTWGAVILISYLSTHYTNILDIIIGGGNLFAGTWLIFWFAGMCLWRWKVIDWCKHHSYAVAAVTTVVLVVWHYIFVGKGLCLQMSPMLNGNEIDLTWAHFFEVMVLPIWFASVMACIESWDNFIIKECLSFVGFIGRRSLYIFLYHILFRNLYAQYVGFNSYAGKLIGLLFVISGPIVFGSLLLLLRRMLNSILGSAAFDLGNHLIRKKR